MRARTYARVLAELGEVQFRRDEGYVEDLAALVKRFDKVLKRGDVSG